MADQGEVQLHFLDYWRVIKNRWGIITLTFLLVVVTAYVTTYFLPRKYTAAVSIEVRSDMKPINVGANIPETPNTGVDPHFVADQLVILQSTGILYPVIKELGLVDKWSAGLPNKLTQQDAYEQLVGMMRNINQKRGTDIIVIPVTSTDRQEAADIANTIAVIYQKRRREDLHSSIANALSELKDEVDKQRVDVDLAAKQLEDMRVKDGIVDPNPETLGNDDSETHRKLLVDEGKLNEANQKVQELQTQFARIDVMSPDELLSAVTVLGIPVDATLPEALNKYKGAASERARLTEQGCGPKHPSIKALDAEMVVWKKQIDDGISSFKAILQTRLEIAQNLAKAAQDVYDKDQVAMQTATKFSAAYMAAKENYLRQKSLLDAADQHYTEDVMQMTIGMDPAKIWDRAEPPRGASSPNVTMYLVIAFIVGLGMGVGLAFFLEYLDTSVKTLADVEKFIGVSVLAVVPKIGGLLHKIEGGRSPDAETYRTLRTNIDFHKPSPDANTLTIISGGPGEGKSTTLCNLAVICANAGSNVLIVDADLRRPSQHKFFDMDGTVGLVDYVNGEKEFDDVIFQTSVENLWLIPSGTLTKDPVAVLNSHRVVELIARAKTQFDLVLFDSPPILGLSDGAVLSSVAEMTVMVVQHRRFPRASLLRVKQAVLNVGGNLTGVVLNRVDTRDDQNYYYYTSYYDYYSPIPATDESRSKADI
ncbi:MAG TPA: polysaccharide biosynthesis tyrosine autokinase [Chthoniobacteraceae bacterium]|nr:polysaccharide biosynthesis tyrosine autokinase [Chthoniobacteraceae bacterium]